MKELRAGELTQKSSETGKGSHNGDREKDYEKRDEEKGEEDCFGGW